MPRFPAGGISIYIGTIRQRDGLSGLSLFFCKIVKKIAMLLIFPQNPLARMEDLWENIGAFLWAQISPAPPESGLRLQEGRG